MKKLFIAVVAIAALCACGNGEKKKMMMLSANQKTSSCQQTTGHNRHKASLLQQTCQTDGHD